MFKIALVVCVLAASCCLVALQVENDAEVLEASAEEGLEERSAEIVAELEADESEDDEYCEWYKCDKDLREPRGFRSIVDVSFLRKFVRNLNPFGKTRLQMHFFLFKREFPDCGRHLDVSDVDTFHKSGLNPSHPTRIIIHGWMSQSRGSLNRDVKNAYLGRGDYNVIVADWSRNAANLNYFSVVKLVEEFGGQLARFTQLLNTVLHVEFDDIYLIGHSLGAQIAGAAGKQIRPAQYKTIFALDPAGPKFRHRSADLRIDPTDAQYVESIQTSGNLGFLEPTGNATFYPNYGLYQQKCFYVGCSHIRAYKMFAESISTTAGFWGTPCERRKPRWECNETEHGMYQMGGDPALPKLGVFYVKTAAKAPFALGRS